MVVYAHHGDEPSLLHAQQMRDDLAGVMNQVLKGKPFEILEGAHANNHVHWHGIPKVNLKVTDIDTFPTVEDFQ